MSVAATGGRSAPDFECRASSDVPGSDHASDPGALTFQVTIQEAVVTRSMIESHGCS
jgi:hypothetical protein